MFPIFAGNSASTGYNLTRSLRTRASASAYLNKTFSTSGTGTGKTWTFSAWIKRGTLSSSSGVFDAYNTSGPSTDSIGFRSDDTFTIYFANAGGGNLTTTQVFRDPSAWYHIVIALDTTQATAANRVKIYLNGTQITAFGTANYPSQNSVFNWGNTQVNNIGRKASAVEYFDGYLAEVNFIDGQALTPSSFGSTNALTGVWQPARYTGTYGTNGFYLPFTDNSALTTSSNVGLGKDFSGNGNYWTTNNISITAGVTYDSMTDVPTLTSATAANFPTFNPLQPHDGGYTTSVTNGNMAVSITYSSGANMVTVPSTIKTSSSGKWYWEVTVTSALAGGATGVGVITPDSYVEGVNPPTNNYLYIQNGNKFINNTATAYGATFTSGDVIGVALDVGAGTITFYKNNVSQGVASTGLAATSYYAVVTSNATGTRSYAINFGQQPFQYTPPTGFIALNSYNLPDSTIVKGNTVMDATLYTGNGSTQTITNAAGFKPDLVWAKSRSDTYSNALTDSNRGVTKILYSNLTASENTSSAGQDFTSFNSNGFSVGTPTNANSTNANGSTIVAWQWQAGQGSSSSNTNGSITSTVSVNASAGFSVVTWTANASANQSIGHGLGVAPSLVIVKDRTTVINWNVWFTGFTANEYLLLNSTAAKASFSSLWYQVPDSSKFYVGSTATAANYQSGDAYVAYCWTPIAGFSAFGSYTGNGSADGAFVYTGFRPKFVMIKEITSGGTNWNILDTSRDPYNVEQKYLAANVSDAEGTLALLDGLSNGFKLRSSGLAVNASGSNYIYMAFAENPFKNALAR